MRKRNNGKGKRGLWDIASQHFAKDTVGDVIALVGDDAHPKSIFYSTELQALKVGTKVNGIPINNILEDGSQKAIDRLNELKYRVLNFHFII